MNCSIHKNRPSYIIKAFAMLCIVFLLHANVQAAAVWTSNANGAWNTAASWTLVSGTPAAAYPTGSDVATIGHSISVTSTQQCGGLTINGSGTLTISSSQALIIAGNFTNSGKLSANNGGIIYFLPNSSSASTTLTQTGTQSGLLIIRFRPNTKTINIAAGSTFTGYQVLFDGTSGTVNNFGTLNASSLFRMGSGVTYRNNTNGVLNLAVNVTFLSAATFIADGNPNTVNYSGSGWNTVYSTTYHHLNLSGTGTTIATKALGGNITANGNITIASNVQLNCANFNVTCGGNWTNNNGTSAMTNTGGTFTFNGSSQTILRKTSAEKFGNVTIASTGNVTLNSANTAGYTGSFSCANLTLQSGTLDVNSTGNYTVTVSGNMSNTGGTFTARNGYVVFNGSAAQTISGNTMTFANITSNNAAGVSTSSAQQLSGTLDVTTGTFTSNTADFTLLSDVTTGITARVGQLTTGSVAGSRWIMQRRIITSAPSNSTPYWDYMSSPVTSTNLSDWDNEMYLSGCGGADGNACCPIFHSVQQWNNGGTNYSNVTSLINLVVGYGYSIWTASTLSTLAPFTFDTRGTLNKGTITKSGLASANYLLGNPYPSQILFSSLTRTNVNNYFYILDETLKDYAYWDGSSNTGTGKLNGSGGVINSSQGFLVKSTGSGSVVFNETAKTTTNTAYVRQALAGNMIKFHFNTSEKQVGMQNLIHFVEGASNDVDELDMEYPEAPFLTNRYEAKSLSPNGTKLCKNTVNLNDLKQEIPVVFKPAEAGDFTLNIEGVSGLTAYTCVMLEDQYNGTFTDLSNTNSYLFTCSDNSERHFVLHFTKGKENISCIQRSKIFASIASGEGIATKVYDAENGISIQFTNEDIRTTSISVYNTIGELISSEEFVGGNQSTIKRPVIPGVYFVVLAREGKTETHKVIIK